MQKKKVPKAISQKESKVEENRKGNQTTLSTSFSIVLPQNFNFPIKKRINLKPLKREKKKYSHSILPHHFLPKETIITLADEITAILDTWQCELSEE